MRNDSVWGVPWGTWFQWLWVWYECLFLGGAFTHRWTTGEMFPCRSWSSTLTAYHQESSNVRMVSSNHLFEKTIKHLPQQRPEQVFLPKPCQVCQFPSHHRTFPCSDFLAYYFSVYSSLSIHVFILIYTHIFHEFYSQPTFILPLFGSPSF